MITAFRVYELYIAFTLHFKEDSTYDFFKFKGKTRITHDGFLKNRAKPHFDRWAGRFHTEEQIIEFLYYNTLFGDISWGGNLTKQHEKKWLLYKDSLNYTLSQEIEKYKDVDFVKEHAKNSKEFYLYFLILDIVTKGMLTKYYEQKCKSNILWEDLNKKLNKHRPFVEYLLPIDIKSFAAWIKKV